MPDTSTSINDRISALREHLHLTQRAFAGAVGVPQSSIAALSGQRGSRPGYEMIQKLILAFPEVSADWLLLGTGPMLREPGHSLIPRPVEQGQPVLLSKPDDAHGTQLILESQQVQIAELQKQVERLNAQIDLLARMLGETRK